MDTAGKELNKHWFIIILASTLAVFTLYALWPYAASFFEAIILFFLFNRSYHFLNRYIPSKHISAALVILLTFMLIILPIIILLPIFVIRLSDVGHSLMHLFDNIANMPFPFQSFLESKGITVDSTVIETTKQLISKGGIFLLSTVSNVGHAFMNILLMYVIFFFLLIDQYALKEKIRTYWPSKASYLQQIITTTKDILYSVVISSVIIAIFQGLSMGIVFFLTDTSHVFLLTMITCILSFLPLIGAPIIWIPVVLYHFSQAHTSTAIIILVAGLLVSNLDNILRPWIQNRVGNIHPLITIFGVLIGLSLFGISGLVMGPLLIALAINMSAMALEAVRSS